VVGALSLVGLAANTGAWSEVLSIGPSSYPGVVEVQLRFEHALSVDCSPPRACYAKRQWIHAFVNCHQRTVALARVVSMDLNGNVVNDVSPVSPQFVRGYGYRLSDPRDDTPGAVVTEVCGPYLDRD